jgi:hypothetical protein
MPDVRYEQVKPDLVKKGRYHQIGQNKSSHGLPEGLATHPLPELQRFREQGDEVPDQRNGHQEHNASFNCA